MLGNLVALDQGHIQYHCQWFSKQGIIYYFSLLNKSAQTKWYLTCDCDFPNYESMVKCIIASDKFIFFLVRDQGIQFKEGHMLYPFLVFFLRICLIDQILILICNYLAFLFKAVGKEALINCLVNYPQLSHLLIFRS